MEMRALWSKIKKRVFLAKPEASFWKMDIYKCPKTVFGHPAGPNYFPFLLFYKLFNTYF